jgi:hypothetical protein
MRVARWFIAIVGGVLVALWIVVAVGSRTSVLREKLVDTLSDKLNSSVELDSFAVHTFPRLRISGDGLRIRLKDQTLHDPLIVVRHFEVAGSAIGLLRRQRHFKSVTLEGLRISIPPRTKNDREAGNKAAQAVSGPIIIDRVEAHDAALVLVPRTEDKAPRIFAIHDLALESVGFSRSMPFTATLVNPVPRGDITVGGSFGPWRADEPGWTPLSGRYEYTDVDLGTIHGIGGILSSKGDFAGELMEIDVRGTTHTPAFTVDTAAHPVPLDTTFHAVVDGTNGDTYLKQVDATFLQTSLTASGAVTGEKGRKGRTVTLQVNIPHGRIEDVLVFAMKGDNPVMRGTIVLDTAMTIPPGDGSVADRIELDGRFALEQAQFTDRKVRDQIATLSSRARGRNPRDGHASVRSNMHGTFTVKDGRASFRPVTFDVPGAVVALRGSYGLRTERLAFEGTLRMDATLSKAAGGGLKGFFLKLVDPLFKRDGAGAVVPLRVTGTREAPHFGVDWKRALLRK